jgi:hypothetical protein
LKNGFQSVEADIWTFGKSLQVGHWPLIYRGQPRDLYIKPLLLRVLMNNGSVYGDGRTFFLWIDFKDSCPEAVEQLNKQLSQYPIFTEFSDAGIKWKAVTVILTGNKTNKKRFVNLPGVRLPRRDDNSITLKDQAVEGPGGDRWLWYSLDWKKRFKWNGRGPHLDAGTARASRDPRSRPCAGQEGPILQRARHALVLGSRAARGSRPSRNQQAAEALRILELAPGLLP